MKPVPFSILALGAGLLGAGLLLAGCGDSNQVPNCPGVASLADTATITGFRPGAPADPSGEAYTATIAGVTSSCDLDKKTGETTTKLAFTVRATRAPRADGDTYSLPYYVVVTQGERLLSKQVYTLRIAFAPGSAITQVDQAIDQTTVHPETGRQPADYQLLIGFQLTDAQRAYNEQRRRFQP